jgi:NADH-quinone oxidoreductase subunit J
MGNAWSYGVGGLVAVVFLLTNVQLLSRLGAMAQKKNDGSFESTVNKIGHLWVKDHVLAFELSSVLLLGALVGAAIIARPRKQ